MKTVALSLGAAVFLLEAACSPCAPDWKTCASSCDARGTRVLATARVHRALHGPKVRVALLVVTAHSDVSVDARAFQAWVDGVAARTGEVLSQCGVELDVVRAELVAVPSSDLIVTASEPSEGAGERLTPQVKRLLLFARRGLPDDTLAVVAVDQINYSVDQRPSVAGGLSFPSLAYTHPDDFPAHLGVLVGTAYGQCGQVPEPPAERTVAHELGHMLLNLPEHDDGAANLMSRMLGPELRAEQCQGIRDQLERQLASK